MSKARGPRKNTAKPNRPLDPLLACGLRRGIYGPGRKSGDFLSLTVSVFDNAHGFESLFPSRTLAELFSWGRIPAPSFFWDQDKPLPESPFDEALSFCVFFPVERVERFTVLTSLETRFSSWRLSLFCPEKNPRSGAGIPPQDARTIPLCAGKCSRVFNASRAHSKTWMIVKREILYLSRKMSPEQLVQARKLSMKLPGA